MHPRAPSPRALYRRWYAAAGPWAGFFRAVPLVAWAQGIAAPSAGAAPIVRGSAREWARGLAPQAARMLWVAGQAECWLGRPEVLLILDLPGVTSVVTVGALAWARVRPVLLLQRWPEPGALLDADALLGALARTVPRRRWPEA